MLFGAKFSNFAIDNERHTKYYPDVFRRNFRGGEFAGSYLSDNRFLNINVINVFNVFNVLKDLKGIKYFANPNNFHTMGKLSFLPYLAPQVREIALISECGFAASLEDPVTDPEIEW